LLTTVALPKSPPVPAAVEVLLLVLTPPNRTDESRPAMPFSVAPPIVTVPFIVFVPVTM